MATLSTFANFQPTEEVVEEIDTNTVVDTQSADTKIDTPAVDVQELVSDPNEASFELSLEEPTVTDPSLAAPIVEPKPVTPVTQNWKDLIKGVDPKEIAKELGISEFSLEMNEHILRGGSPADYINAKGVDWDKVSDADIIISDMKKEFPNATNQQLERLFNKKYNQTELAEEEDKEDGLLIMQRDAYKLRQERIDQQRSFKIPEAIIPDTVKTQKELELQQQQQAEEFRIQREQVIQFFENHEITKNLMTSKRVAQDLGELGNFYFKVDKPELITKAMTDDETWGKLVSTPQGEPDIAKRQLIALFAFNPKKFATDLVNYGKSLGQEELVAEGHNAKKPTGVLASMVEERPTYSLGKGGVSKT